MYNFQAKLTTSLRKARYLEKGSAFKTHRKDSAPHRKDCDCKVCKAYWAAIKEVVTPEVFAKRTEKEESKFFLRKKALPEHVHRRRMLAQSIGMQFTR